MEGSDFFTFLFSLLVFLYLMRKKRKSEKAEKEHPNYHFQKPKEQKNLEELLNSWEKKEKKSSSYLREKQAKLPLPRTEKEIKPNIPKDNENRLDVTLAPKYEIYKFYKSSRVNRLIKNLPSKKEMFILQTIIDKPKGMS